MRPGPAPTPTAIKIAKGNPGRRPLNDREPDAQIIERLPNAPREFAERAAKCWREVGNCLIATGLLTELGLNALYRYCNAFGNYHHARAQVEKFGIVLVNSKTGAPYLNPFFIALSMASKDLRIFEAEFGMTPAAATRVRVANPKQLDLFGQLFEGEDDAESDPPIVQ